MNTCSFSFVVDQTTRPAIVSAVKSEIRSWISSSPFLDLLAMYHAQIDVNEELNTLLPKLEEFSNRWDFRRMAREQGVAADDNLRHGAGAARWLSAEAGLSPDLEERVLEDAKRLGMIVAEDPRKKEYDYILVLGGARLSCKLRSERAAEVIRAGIATKAIGLLGAARPVAETEREATDSYAPGAKDEFDLMVAGAHSAFGPTSSLFSEERNDDPSEPNRGWIDQRFEIDFGGNPVRFVAVSAPSSDPQKRRANSADTIIFFLKRVDVQPGARLLLITSQIYVPYVQLEALRTVAVPHGIYVETIGFPGDRMPSVQGLTNTNNYLQEVRSAIQAARRFCTEYPN